MKTCILIPVHNEALQIGRLVAELRRRKYPVVVVDDGSQDNSGVIAKDNGAEVIRNDEKMGKGRSLQRGFRYILDRDYDAVLTMDGDGQHDIDDVEKFVEKAKEFPQSVVTGTRMQNPEGMPVVRLWTNRIMSGMISATCRQRVPDTQCGFRLISCDILRTITLSSSDFEIETEVLIKASKKGFKIYSVPIKTIYSNEVSKINPVLDTVRFIVYLFKEMWT